MSVNYTWIFDRFECQQNDDNKVVVKMVHWKLFGISNTVVSDSLGGTVVLDSPESETFINFSDLTFDTVKSWVESKLNVAKLHAEVDAIIVQKNSTNNITMTGPWHIPPSLP